MKSKLKTTCNLHSLPWYCGWLMLAVVGLCGTVSYLSFFHLPAALTEADLKRSPYAFNGARAWTTLTALDALGPKPTGSIANEIEAVKLLERELQVINATRHAAQEVQYEKQIVSGAYGFNDSSMASVYRKVQNLIVKLAGEPGSPEALMLNCHFDSVASSPGASDDCGNCAVMLELLRVLSREPRRQRHSVVFLFNGAEETPLQASHGFIMQHRWAADVRAFLNLESAGSGGKELLFQSGPEHPWLIEAYAKAVRHPFGHAIGEEIFQSGFIPSDTDFRIFRDFGHIPGLDFAHIFNGYRYHTRYDSVQYLAPAVLQRTGDNMLSLVRLLANGDYLAQSTERSTGKMVFFDFLGLFFVSHSATVAATLNVLVAAVGLLIGLYATLYCIGWRHWRTVVVEMLLHGFGATLVGAGAAIGCNLTIAFILDRAFDRSMTWFSSQALAVGVYCAPAMMLLLIAHRESHRLFHRAKTVLPLPLTIKARTTGVYLFWSVIMLGATFAGLRSAYVISVLLSCMAFIPLVSGPHVFCFKSSLISGALLALCASCHVAALLWTTQFYHIFTNIFIPISGRSGANDNPDLIIGAIVAACTLLVCSFLLPLINLLRKPYYTIGALLGLFLAALLLATVTPLGFPYREATPHQTPKVQRILVQHTLRQRYDHNGTVQWTNSGYLFRLWDRHNERTILEAIAKNDASMAPSVVSPTQLPECAVELFCGLPASALRFNSLWSPQTETNRPHTPSMVTLTLVSREQVTQTPFRTKLMFNLTGSFQSSLLVRPKPKVTLVGWNLTPKVAPKLVAANHHRAHFVLITHGLPGEPVRLVFEIETAAAVDEHSLVMDISVTTNFWEYHEHFTPRFTQFVASFPAWAHVVPAVTVVNLYTF
ncbi:endoplasmic reticulum metallopeptidase 1-like [Anopheles cruzii]|uniref:endoplasmic reticulum metallopeptidase 1-like n=1 Tax=Anopheles cruzii TaxID=68878 RepID=UPI0022EC8E0E|nr:endoplasmic reticulum metallopeptidase 1-like [Anopheles cruzii]